MIRAALHRGDWNRRRAGFVLALVALVGLSYGLLRWVQSSLRVLEPSDSQAPILIIDQLRAVRMNLAGLREYVVEAPRLWQLPGKGGAYIAEPVLDWYPPEAPTYEWRLQAQQAWAAADQQVLRLEGAVSLNRTAVVGRPPLRLTTHDVTLYPTERYAETAAWLLVQTPGGELTAIGARAWLAQQRVELLSHVRGFYVPPQP